jgi:hypothetical protein
MGVAVVGAVFLLLRYCTDRSADRRHDPDVAEAAAPRSPVASDRAANQSPGTSEAGSTQSAPDEAGFVERMVRVDARRALADMPYSTEIVDLVASARIPETAQQLESKAAQGDNDANAVLAQLYRLCSGIDPVAPPAAPLEAARGPAENMPAASEQLPATARRNIELSRIVEQRERDDLRRACARTRFDAAAIDLRLARAAETGHEASLWELGRRSVDPDLRHKHWLSAAMLGYVPAQVGLAEVLMAQTREDDRRGRGRMNFWLEAAAKQSTRARLLLGECRLSGCNAQPPDAQAAASLLRDAALEGESAALTALTSIPRDDPAAPTDADLFALHSLQHALNELGCFGAGAYDARAFESRRALDEIGRRLSPHRLEEARALAAELWHERAAQARQSLGCN